MPSHPERDIDGQIDVLYVDDDRGLLDLTAEFLEQRHDQFTVTTVASASAALELLDERSFDAIVSDYQMPEMDGLTLLKRLREDRNLELPFIVFTGKSREEIAVEALNLGADRYLQKGGDPTSQYGHLVEAIQQEVTHYRTQQRLREREEYLRTTLESIGDAVITTDAEGNVTRMNSVAEELTEWRNDDAVGRPLDVVFQVESQETREPIEDPARTVLRDGQTIGLANGTVLTGKNGTERIIADSAAPIEGEDGEVRGVVVVFRDITERYRRDRRQERQKETVIEISTDEDLVAGRFDAAARTITEAATETLDVDRTSIWLLDDRETLRCRDLYDRDDDSHHAGMELNAENYPAYFDALRDSRSIAADDARQDPRTAGLDEEYLRPLGITSMLDATIRADGEVVGVVCHEHTDPREWHDDEIRFAGEISDQVLRALHNEQRRERRREIRQKNQRLSHLVDQSPLGVVEWNLDFEVTRWNAVAEDIFGYSAEEMTGSDAAVIVPLDQHDQVEEIWADLLETHETTHTIRQNVTADGERIICEWHSEPITADGELLGVLSIVQDVTEQRRRSRQLEAIVENTAKEAIYIKDTDGRYQFINEAGAEVFGRERDAVLGRRAAELYDDVQSDHLEVDRQVLETQEPVSYERTRTVDGRTRHFLAEKYPHYDENGELIGIMGISRDVTERKQIESLLEQFHRITTDPDIDFDERVERLLSTIAAHLNLANGHVGRVDGSKVTIEYAVGDPDLAGTADRARDRETCCRLGLENDEFTAISNAGGEEGNPDPLPPAIGSYVGAPVTVNGETWGSVCFADPEPAEEAFSEAELTIVELAADWLSQELDRREYQRELEWRNETLENLVDVLSHDLQSPLSIARGTAELAREHGTDENFDRLDRALAGLEETVDDALALVEHGRSVEDTDIVDVAAESRDVWDRIEASGASLIVEDEPIRIDGDPGSVRIVIQNLLENAIKHADSEVVTVRVGALDGGGFYVADDGTGIAADDAETVFEHGYTTHRAGSGLGLAIVAQIAEAHDWDLDLSESHTGGARFEISSTESTGELK